MPFLFNIIILRIKFAEEILRLKEVRQIIGLNRIMKGFFKIGLSIVTASAIAFFLYAQVGFLINKKYTITFIDFMTKTNMVAFAGVMLFLMGMYTKANMTSRKKRYKWITIATLLSVIVLWHNAWELDKSNRVVYQQNLGSHMHYLYLNEENNSYILELIWPAGKHVTVGYYDQEGTVIELNRDLRKTFREKIYPKHPPQTTLDLKDMEKLDE